MNESGRGTGGAIRHRLRNALVIGEVALALVLLTGAGCSCKASRASAGSDPGVQPERLFTARIGLPDAAYPKPENVIAFYDQLLPKLRALPGVNAASLVMPLPLSGSNITTSFDVEERPVPAGAALQPNPACGR